MPHDWNTTTLDSAAEAEQKLIELQGKRWLCRGHSKERRELIPSIDRNSLKGFSREKKLLLERRSIDLFRSNARHFSSDGEKGAMADDVIALMVLRHYDVPTRLLDWSKSPFVAAHFAACNENNENGELWVFDEPLYEVKGKWQWRRFPETTTDGSGDDDKFAAGITAFAPKSPNWFIAAFYPKGFPRQTAQDGAYTMTPNFNIDHADAIKDLLNDDSCHHLYIIPAKIKAELRTILREKHGIWRGSLFPDTAGAAATALDIFPNDCKPMPCNRKECSERTN